MKNIHILPTDKPSRLFIDIDDNKLKLTIPIGGEHMMNQNIYITSNEEIKEGDYILIHGHYQYGKHVTKVRKITGTYEVIEGGNHSKKVCQKIILTTDQDLIKDGIQAIDDEFLEWFVKNPSCESVEVVNIVTIPALQLGSTNGHLMYKVIIPNLEICKDCNINLTDCTCIEDTIDMKQETLEEAAERFRRENPGTMHGPNNVTIVRAFIAGTKWQQERSYSEEDMRKSFDAGYKKGFSGYPNTENWKELPFKEWFEQFKNK